MMTRGQPLIATDVMTAAQGFIDFVDKTGSPFHTVAAAVDVLEAAGFTRLDDTRPFPSLAPGAKHYVTRNHSAVMAFSVGAMFNPESSGIVIAAGHTDSPCLRVQPCSNFKSEGYLMLGVETYGGGLWNTWFDRGLGVAGKVVVETENGLEERLVKVTRAICVIPNLAIHLRKGEERENLVFNNETNLRPILCSEVAQQLACPAEEGSTTPAVSSPLLDLLAKELNCDPLKIVSVDLSLFDVTPARVCGIHDEFIESGRIDNVGSTWAIMEALCNQDLRASADINVGVAFDHEEIGSRSFTGADSSILPEWLSKIAQGAATDYTALIRRSFLVSSDMAHGVHPNWAEKHQSQHKPMFGQGVVIKENVNQRYTSHATTIAMTRKVASMAKPNPVKMQEFVVRNDSPCGSTIGPMTAARLGLRAVDFGSPQWAMHSARECCSTLDLVALRDLVRSFYDNFRAVDMGTKLL